jgi:hypothetical protein
VVPTITPIKIKLAKMKTLIEQHWLKGIDIKIYSLHDSNYSEAIFSVNGVVLETMIDDELTPPLWSEIASGIIISRLNCPAWIEASYGYSDRHGGVKTWNSMYLATKVLGFDRHWGKISCERIHEGESHAIDLYTAPSFRFSLDYRPKFRIFDQFSVVDSLEEILKEQLV